ncbi:hypothetical protein [Streptomyces sp. NPDC096030]|uniref:hypothetical protein n=1 Tax=Streptomyces sp. NPDC096030 TaxID=3155423 RepID=UPI003316AF18
MTEQHEPEQWHFNADTNECPHGPEPEDDASDEWEEWTDRHPTYDDGRLCLDAPAGEACGACSADDGEMVPWSHCRARTHRRPQRGVAAGPGAEHRQVPIWIGATECLERECDGYFDDDGDEIPGLEHCSHIQPDTACSCQEQPDGDYSDEPCPLNVPAADPPRDARRPPRG